MGHADAPVEGACADRGRMVAGESAQHGAAESLARERDNFAKATPNSELCTVDATGHPRQPATPRAAERSGRSVSHGRSRGLGWLDIEAPIERCLPSSPTWSVRLEWQGSMQSARALEHNAEGRPVLVETQIHAIVANVTLLLRFAYSEPTGMSWTRERGDLRSLSGEWQLEDRGGGCTRATYSLEIGLNRTLGLLRKGVRGPAEAKVRELLTHSPVEGLKREAER